MPSDPAKTKAVKAWGVVDKDGSYWSVNMFKRSATELAAIYKARVIPVLITPIEGTDLKGRKSK